jgi:hypothetical protein
MNLALHERGAIKRIHCRQMFPLFFTVALAESAATLPAGGISVYGGLGVYSWGGYASAPIPSRPACSIGT